MFCSDYRTSSWCRWHSSRPTRRAPFCNFEHNFFLNSEKQALLLGGALLAWVAIGLWLEIYDKLDSAHPRIILRDTAKQCAYGALFLVVFEYVLRLDLSRSFVVLFAGLAWVLLLLFRLTAGRMVGVFRRGFAAPHYVMVVGTDDRARGLAKELEQSLEYGVRLRGFLSELPDAARSEILLGAAYPVYPIRELPALLGENVIDEIVFAVGSESIAELEEVFLLCDEEGVRTRDRGGLLPARQQHRFAGPLRRHAAADFFSRAVRRDPAAGEAS